MEDFVLFHLDEAEAKKNRLAEKRTVAVGTR